MGTAARGKTLGGQARGLMNKLKRVTGTWQGIYDHDPSERIPKPQPVPFTLTLKQGWFGHFTGTVSDDPARGTPGMGVIDGWFSFPRIEFIKRMPVFCLVTTDGGSVTLRDYLAQHGYDCPHEVPHPPIFCRGEFCSPSRAEGTWVIPPSQTPLPDGRYLKLAETRGVWSIENAAA